MAPATHHRRNEDNGDRRSRTPGRMWLGLLGGYVGGGPVCCRRIHRDTTLDVGNNRFRRLDIAMLLDVSKDRGVSKR
jgi:hypothetical protein